MGLKKRRSTRAWDRWPSPLCGLVELARRLQVGTRTVSRWRESGRLVAGKHYTVVDGRAVFVWQAVAKDFMNP